MSYDEEQTKRSRVVIETPTSRREVVQQQTVRYPEERRGYSAGVLAAVALTAIAATAIIFLFLMNRGDDSTTTNVNVRATTQPTPLAAQQPPVVAPQPVTQATPIVVQQPPPVIITQPAPADTTTAPTTTAPPASTAPPAASSGSDDMAVQARLDDAMRKDREVFDAGVTAIVVNGKATLNGAVRSDALKERAEKVAYAVRGVRSVDNQITVITAP